MPRVLCVFAALCLLAGLGSLWVATSSAIAKQKPTMAAKNKSSAAAKKQKSVAARKKEKSLSAKNPKSVVSAKEKPRMIPEPRTPVDKHDCIAAAQDFYAQAQALAGRKTVPQEFLRVVSQLDEFCGEEEFEKARINIDWMNLCLHNFTTGSKAEFCSMSESYFCAIDPHSQVCVTSEARTKD